MKRIIFLFTLICTSFNLFALDEYSSATDAQKRFVAVTIKNLAAPNTNDVKVKIYNSLAYIFNSGDWSSYWLGYNDLSASKITNPDVTFIEHFINTAESGAYFVSFLYDKTTNQILVNTKQIRYGSKNAALELFNTQKSDTDEYKVIHEEDNYALVQESGRVEFAAFNLGSSSASVVYFEQEIIDL
jgi:hypothetical protein